MSSGKIHKKWKFAKSLVQNVEFFLSSGDFPSLMDGSTSASQLRGELDLLYKIHLITIESHFCLGNIVVENVRIGFHTFTSFNKGVSNNKQ
jgi:hypothetical protein